MSQYRLKILSLGAGVQSSTILLMACKGVIEKPDLAIFADTGWERMATYAHLEWLKTEAGRHGIEVLITDNGNIKEKMIHSMYRGTIEKGYRWASMPLFVINDGKIGMMRRQCTKEHKIDPIKKATRKALGIAPKQRAPKDSVEQWVGISLDEYQRIFTRKSDRMTSIRYPLIEMGMTRYDCEKWLMDNYHIVVPKSSCVGCPFHRDKEWRELLPDEFRDACEFDRQIRYKVGDSGQAYLHRSCRPLEDIDFRTKEERGQLVFDFVKDEKLNLFVNNLSIIEKII